MSATKAFSIVLIEAWANLLISQDYVRNTQREDAFLCQYFLLCALGDLVWCEQTPLLTARVAEPLSPWWSCTLSHTVPAAGPEGSHQVLDWGHCLPLGVQPLLAWCLLQWTFPPCLWAAVAELMFLALALAGVEHRSLVCCPMCGRDRGLQKGSGSPGPVFDPACMGGTAGTQGATPGAVPKAASPSCLVSLGGRYKG